MWEMRSHERNLARLPVRVHVNGTRGKSSVTRLIAAGLRSGGVRAFAKTTGTMARIIRPDGLEVDVYRVGSPNIIEQTRIVRRAVEDGAAALVIECMAVTPELQPLVELRLIKSTVGVITNCRADHLDVMGPTVDDVAHALAQTCPVGGHLFTAERERAGILEAVARGRGSAVHVVPPDGVTVEELAGFSYFEHAENVALALAVCAHLGVPRAAALAGMHAAAPDPGVLRRYTVRSGDKTVEFVNAFAANDPDSTLLIWQRLGLEQRRPGVQRMILANCRPDRLQRSGQIAELVAKRLSADHVVLSGEGTDLVAFQALNGGLDRERLSNLGGLGAEAVYEHVLALVRHEAVIVGIGNIVGLGEEITLHFSNRAVRRG
ncbi:MAG: poly-gamma-glutamate synthase PgsB [Candidatus Eisenbacteria bacterium]|nr:poly-gamma-glutamate synthase PgsB [Candidatus Eisenbacteria bacterium]